MTEGKLRALIATAVRDVKHNGWTADDVADVVLAVLRPHLGPGVTDEQRAMMTTALDGIERAVTEFEGAEQRRWVAEYVSVLRAIAGRGEVESAEGE